MTSEVMDRAQHRLWNGGMTSPVRNDPSVSNAPPQVPPAMSLDHRILLGDAALTGANGVAYLALSGLLADAFGCPQSLLLVLGGILVAVAVFIVAVVARPVPSRPGLAALVGLNLTWVVASIGYAAVGGLTLLGAVWTLLQAAIVALFAGLQLRMLKR